tara:strand:- start:1670 stop:1864 length:195 start_codon:yes stop_codon:yes gene_type:complete
MSYLKLILFSGYSSDLGLGLENLYRISSNRVKAMPDRKKSKSPTPSSISRVENRKSIEIILSFN